MSYQSEAELESLLIKQLGSQNYSFVTLNDYDALVANFKEQFSEYNKEKLGEKTLSKKEFDRLLNCMLGRTVYESAVVLRDKYVLERDDGSRVYVSFVDEDPSKNIWQVTNQTTVVGKYTNRYAVTILCNGFPLVQIELKRRGLDLRQAINQIMRYKKHSYIGLGFFYSLEQKEGPLQNSHFATVPHGVMPRSHRSFSVFGRKRLNGLQLRPEARPVQSQYGIRRVRRAADRAGVEEGDAAALLQRGMVRVAEER